MHQSTLFPTFDAAERTKPTVKQTFTDPRLSQDAKPRLGGQNGAILERLRVGPATNIELEAVSGSRRINSRIADVRRYLREHEGKTVESKAIDTASGLYEYRIV